MGRVGNFFRKVGRGIKKGAIWAKDHLLKPALAIGGTALAAWAAKKGAQKLFPAPGPSVPFNPSNAPWTPPPSKPIDYSIIPPPPPRASNYEFRRTRPGESTDNYIELVR
jgi:hypothetical protein